MKDHTITALEPLWVRTELELSGSGWLTNIKGTEEYVDAIEYLMEEARYECSCGAEFDDYMAAEEHARQVAVLQELPTPEVTA